MSKFIVFVAALCLAAMTAMIIIGISTPYWVSRPGHYSGLWKYCMDGLNKGQETKCIKLDDRPDFEPWMNAVRALVLLAVASSGISLMLIKLYLCYYDGQRNLLHIRAIVLFILLAALLSILGIVVYASEQPRHKNGYKFGWSFIITATFGAALTLLTIPLGCEIRDSRRLGAYESI